MDKSIKINLRDETFDVEIHGLSLNCLSKLSTLPEEVAENLKRALLTIGKKPEKVETCVSLLLQGRSGIRDTFGVYL